jgi:Mycobacterium membrane protein
MSRRIAAVAALLLPLIPLIAAPEATAAGPWVVYSVNSNGSLSSISYYDGNHQLQNLLDVPAPWRVSFRSQETYPVYSVSAQTKGTEVSCQITLDGQVVGQAGQTGSHSIAGCSSLSG